MGINTCLILGFVPVHYVLSDLARFGYPENIGLCTIIVILCLSCLLELDISARLNF